MTLNVDREKGNNLAKFMQDRLALAKQVVKSGRHNLDPLGMRVNINERWNIPFLIEELHDYDDKIIIDYFQFGWPANRDMLAPDPVPSDINHKGANNFEHDIDKYLTKEIMNRRMIGPLDRIPFENRVGISPLNSREKRDSLDRRIIVDFSWPMGQSVNDGIKTNTLASHAN